MPTVFLSDQVTKTDAVPSKKIKPSELAGRTRVLFFSKTLPASGLALGDTIRLGKLPAGARLLSGEFAWDTAQGVTATTAIGYSGTPAAYFAAAVTNSTAQFAMLNTIALAYGSETTAETEVLATNAAAAWAASSKLFGKIVYVVD